MTNKKNLNNQQLHSGIVNSEHNYIFYMSDNNRTLNIEISYLRGISLYGENPYINVDKMEEELSTIRLPLPINEIYKKIVNGLKCNIKLFSFIRVREDKKTRKGFMEIEYLYIRHGELVELVTTKNNRKVTIKNNDIKTYDEEISSKIQNNNVKKNVDDVIKLVKKPSKSSN